MYYLSCFKLRCVLGEISSVGGTVFALQVLIVAALLGGKLVSLIGLIKSFECIHVFQMQAISFPKL